MLSKGAGGSGGWKWVYPTGGGVDRMFRESSHGIIPFVSKKIHIRHEKKRNKRHVKESEKY